MCQRRLCIRHELERGKMSASLRQNLIPNWFFKPLKLSFECMHIVQRKNENEKDWKFCRPSRRVDYNARMHVETEINWSHSQVCGEELRELKFLINIFCIVTYIESSNVHTQAMWSEYNWENMIKTTFLPHTKKLFIFHKLVVYGIFPMFSWPLSLLLLHLLSCVVCLGKLEI